MISFLTQEGKLILKAGGGVLKAENAEEIVSKCVELALAGDSTCMKLCMERLLPPRRFIQMESKISAMGILGMFPVPQEIDDSGVYPEGE